MRKLKLSPRLNAAARMALGGNNIADVGTDHGYVPVWLAQTDARAVLTASDVREAPLERARCTARRYGLEARIRFVLADGLDFPGAEAADTVLLCGMGGETIASILLRAPWTRRGVRLILQPQTKAAELCRALADVGLSLADAALALDAGRLYPVLCASAGRGLPGAATVEDALLAKRDPLLQEWLDRRAAVLEDALPGMALGAAAETEARARRELRRLEEIRKETLTWQR